MHETLTELSAYWQRNNPHSHHWLSTVTHQSPHLKMNCYFAVNSWMQFSPSSVQNSVRVIFWQYRCLHAISDIFQNFPKCTPNISKFPWIFSPPMPHLNKSVIRWIAVRWQPNKATQIRVNIDSSVSAHDSLWWHHVATLTTIHILPSLFWQDGDTEGKVKVGEGEQGLCSVVHADCWSVL